ncbi:MAG TPA: di-heme oxidoredictase family protein [Acidobacteriota bacterium]|jgi:cytochrome c peroxidase
MRKTAWILFFSLLLAAALANAAERRIGQEVSISTHLKDGEEFQLSITDVIAFGQKLFNAIWTIQEGGGRPLTKGNGNPLSDANSPLVFPRNFNRISAPDANSCAGCHNLPVSGGAGDFVTNVFVLGQRFDFATFDGRDLITSRGAIDEGGVLVNMQSISNSRKTVGMFGSGFIEMLARQITTDLQTIRDSLAAGASKPLRSKGISFGTLARFADGRWDVSRIEGLPATSLQTTGPDSPPSLIIKPFHQAGAVVSLREFTNNAFNHHHGIQTTERFGVGADPDGDGVVNEMTRADVTAVAMFQATMAVPGRVIPNDFFVDLAVHVGANRFEKIGCAGCHIPILPLDNKGWIYTEPNPYNPVKNLRPGDAPSLSVDLTSDALPQPRLKPVNGVVHVPAFTDFKLHDICSGQNDPNGEALDQNQPLGSIGFFAGNRKFITRRLWGVANQPPYFHHGLFTTMRQAILAHDGEALASRQAFQALSRQEQDSVIEFLKTLRVLPAGSPHLITDENGKQKAGE